MRATRISIDIAWLLSSLLFFCYTSQAVAFYPYNIDNNNNAVSGAAYITKNSITKNSKVENPAGVLEDSRRLEIRQEKKPRAIAIEDISFGSYVKNFVTPISIGTPPQKHLARITTDGLNLFGIPIERDPDFNCTKFGSFFNICTFPQVLGTYLPNQSSSYINLTSSAENLKKYKRWYKGTKTPGFNSSGSWGTDNIQIGDELIKDSTIQIAEDYTALYAQISTTPSNTSTSSVSVIDQLYKENTIAAKAIGIYLGDYATNKSQITIGGVDQSKYEGGLLTLKAYAATSGLRTLVYMDSIIYDNGVTNETFPRNGPAQLRSSANLIAAVDWSLQSTLFKKSLGIVSTLVGLTDAFLRTEETRIALPVSYYVCPCTQPSIPTHTLIFNFNSSSSNNLQKQITVNLSHFLIPDLNEQGEQMKSGNGTPLCRLTVEEINDNSDHDLILGTSFNRGAYVVQDFGNMEISIAQSISSSATPRKKEFVVLKAGGVTATSGVRKATKEDAKATEGGDNAKESQTSENTNNNDDNKTNKSGIIGGATAGAVALLSAIALLAFIFRRRYLKRREEQEGRQRYEKAELPPSEKERYQLDDGTPTSAVTAAAVTPAELQTPDSTAAYTYAHEMPVPTSDLPPPPTLPGPPKPLSELSSSRDG